MIALPGIGPVPLDGFSHPALLAVAAAPMALVVGYVLVQSQLRRRTERFADPALLSTVSPRRAHPLRHLPIALAVIGLLLLTVAVAGPSRDIRVPRNRAVIMLVIDVSQSMRATDVAPTRLAAAQDAARHFAESLTPGVNLGLVAFAGHPNLLVSPTPDHQATIAALANLKPDDSTATGDAIFAALQAISTVAAVLSSGQKIAPPARIALLSDGGENKPTNPDDPHGCFTAARTAKMAGVPVSTISIGTKGGYVAMGEESVPVPVEDTEMKRIAELSGGRTFTAANVAGLNRSYTAIQEQVGYETVQGPARAGWLRLGMLAVAAAAVAALVINRRLPT
jgi:Ca-activated chloride channel family protein